MPWIPDPDAASPLTTKGDLWVYTTDDARLPVGTDGQVLTADSGQSSGVKWGTPASGSGPLQEIDLTSTTAFTSISGAYDDLRVVIVGRSSVAAAGVAVSLRFNSDSGSNYTYNRIQQAAGTVTGQESTSTTGLQVGVVTGSSSPSGAPGTIDVAVPGYSATSFHKAAIFQGGEPQSYASTGMVQRSGVAWWKNTAAVTRIDVVLGSGSWESGSVARLYAT